MTRWGRSFYPSIPRISLRGSNPDDQVGPGRRAVERALPSGELPLRPGGPRRVVVRCISMLAGSLRNRQRDPYDVPIQVSDHEITMSPRAVSRRLDDLGAHPLNLLEEVVESTVDPELRLHGTRQAMGGLVLPQEVNRNAVTGQNCIDWRFAIPER